jgi:hypothetical protein
MNNRAPPQAPRHEETRDACCSLPIRVHPSVPCPPWPRIPTSGQNRPKAAMRLVTSRLAEPPASEATSSPSREPPPHTGHNRPKPDMPRQSHQLKLCASLYFLCPSVSKEQPARERPGLDPQSEIGNPAIGNPMSVFIHVKTIRQEAPGTRRERTAPSAPPPRRVTCTGTLTLTHYALRITKR